MCMCNLIQSNEWLVSSSKHYSSNVGGCPLKFTYYFIEAIAVSCWWSLLLLLLLCNGKGTKVVVSILFSASRFFFLFSFHLLCAFIYKGKQTGKEIQRNGRRRQNNFDRFSLSLSTVPPLYCVAFHYFELLAFFFNNFCATTRN